MKICICCSVKFFPVISDFVANYPDSNYEFLTPDSSFSGENNLVNRRKLAMDHLEKIHHSDAVYIYNPEGMIGKSVTLEMGQAVALGKRIIAHQEIGDVGSDCILDEYIKIEEL